MKTSFEAMLSKTGMTIFLVIALPTLIFLLIHTTMKQSDNFHYQSASNPKDGLSLEKLYKFVSSEVYGIREMNGLNVSLSKLPKCPRQPVTSVGTINVDISPVSSMQELPSYATNVSFGGHWKPPHCKARHKVAIIVPFRDREEHLKIFLRHMHPFLQHQNLEYGIYVIEQVDEEKFNRGALLNIGFVLASKEYAYQCYIFHDIDNLPANDRMPYSCSNFPYHMATAVKKFGYRLPYESYCGGVFSIRKEQFQKINGFSNVYFGWGAEDDDLWQRLEHAQLPIKRYTGGIFHFEVIPHPQNSAAEDRMGYLQRASKRFDHDGLSNLNFTLISYKREKLYTHVKVQLSKTILRQVD